MTFIAAIRLILWRILTWPIAWYFRPLDLMSELSDRKRRLWEIIGTGLGGGIWSVVASTILCIESGAHKLPWELLLSAGRFGAAVSFASAIFFLSIPKVFSFTLKFVSDDAHAEADRYATLIDRIENAGPAAYRWAYDRCIDAAREWAVERARTRALAISIAASTIVVVLLVAGTGWGEAIGTGSASEQK